MSPENSASIDNSKYEEQRKEGDSHHHLPLSTPQFAGDDKEFLILGNKKYKRSDLMDAFGGTLNPGVSPYPVNQFANPAPLGLAAFAFTTFILSLYNARAMGITIPNVTVSSACFYGGACQFLAGAWELLLGNTFGGTALCSYGAFWLSYAAIFIESFEIASAYDDETMFTNAVGFYLLAWGLFTFMLVLVTIKSTLAFFLLFFFLMLTFFVLAAGEFTQSIGTARAGGVLGVITAILGWYNAFAGTADKQNSYFRVHSLPLPKFGSQ